MNAASRPLLIAALFLALALPSTGSAEARVVLRPTRVERVIDSARALRGARYLFGAASKRDDAVDCSSLVQKAFRGAGLRLPRSAYQQSRVGRAVPLEKIRRGDRLYFKMTDRKVPIDHTGIYLGEGRMLHAFPGKDVAEESLEPYRIYLVSARR